LQLIDTNFTKQSAVSSECHATQIKQNNNLIRTSQTRVLDNFICWNATAVQSPYLDKNGQQH